MTGMTDPYERIAAAYRRWGALEARGRSELYERACEIVAEDAGLLAFLAALPPPKRQPNLFFGAVKFLFGTPLMPSQIRDLVLDHADDVAATMSERSTQTNVPARCATLLPALAGLDGPLALLEVGSAAGLCLIPDRYEYLFVDEPDVPTPDRREPTRVLPVDAVGPPAPVFTCRADPTTPRPRRNVEVVWRAGLDLNPLRVSDPDARAWLDALVWPGEDHLRDQLHLALDVAGADPPWVARGDLLQDLPDLVAEAPAGATLVVFHSAVLAYLQDADRAEFASVLDGVRRERQLVWLANEAATRIPRLPPAVVDQHPAREFLLCRDGTPVACTDPHGAQINWLDPSRQPLGHRLF